MLRLPGTVPGLLKKTPGLRNQKGSPDSLLRATQKGFDVFAQNAVVIAAGNERMIKNYIKLRASLPDMPILMPSLTASALASLTIPSRRSSIVAMGLLVLDFTLAAG